MSLKRFCWVTILTLFAAAGLFAEPTKEAGKELFVANCGSCHAKNMKDKLTGPALSGVEARWADYPRTDLYKWVRASQSMIAAGHPRATVLWNEYKPTVMQNFPSLTDEQIESIILFVNDPGGAPIAVSVGGGKPVNDPGIPWMYVGLAIFLGLLAFGLIRIVDKLNNYNRIRNGEAPIEKSLWSSMTSRGGVAFIVFAATLLLGYKSVDNATKMQRQQGYEPTQPIAFSHKIHAGDNGIDCQFCHDGARRSKHASIPAANTCMNCHAAVKKGTISGTSEITKIYASIGFDPLVGQYVPNYENLSDDQIETLYKKWIGAMYMDKAGLTALDEAGQINVQNEWDGIVKALKNDGNGRIQGPIEWTKIHNTADHVYFNHAQHVTVGKVECEKCHGPVKEMDVLYQYSTLGMGWCINCHRETEVKFADNAFYKQYNPEFIKLHKEATHKAEGDLNKITVEDIGGLECQKCHY